MEITSEKAQEQLEHLIEVAATGEVIIILLDGIPAARLVSISSSFPSEFSDPLQEG